MRHILFYEDYLRNVLTPRFMSVAAAHNDITSIAEFHKLFMRQYQVKVSYELFRRWMKDSGVTIEHRSTIRVPGFEQPTAMGGRGGPSAPTPPPQVDELRVPQPNEVDEEGIPNGPINYTPMRPVGPPRASAQALFDQGRGGIVE